jgi:hypothetical protein
MSWITYSGDPLCYRNCTVGLDVIQIMFRERNSSVLRNVNIGYRSQLTSYL